MYPKSRAPPPPPAPSAPPPPPDVHSPPDWHFAANAVPSPPFAAPPPYAAWGSGGFAPNRRDGRLAPPPYTRADPQTDVTLLLHLLAAVLERAGGRAAALAELQSALSALHAGGQAAKGRRRRLLAEMLALPPMRPLAAWAGGEAEEVRAMMRAVDFETTRPLALSVFTAPNSPTRRSNGGERAE